MRQNILILGGTTEGHQLADRLAVHGNIRVVTSLAGRTALPRLPLGDVRLGGFGGALALTDWLKAKGINAVIDATHPFAATMGRHAAMACDAAHIPLLRLDRPAWVPRPGDHWQMVEDWDQAAALLAPSAKRVLLALGRQDLTSFAGLSHVWFLIRSVDSPSPLPAFAQADVITARGPFSLADEIDLLTRYTIDCIVCKNSGGRAASAKLAAARQLGLRMIIRNRPHRPALPSVFTLEAALHWLDDLGIVAYHDPDRQDGD
jgi:precorrin-6A/cobalt-precorrin-6A reductase